MNPYKNGGRPVLSTDGWLMQHYQPKLVLFLDCSLLSAR